MSKTDIERNIHAAERGIFALERVINVLGRYSTNTTREPSALIDGIFEQMLPSDFEVLRANGKELAAVLPQIKGDVESVNGSPLSSLTEGFLLHPDRYIEYVSDPALERGTPTISHRVFWGKEGIRSFDDFCNHVRRLHSDMEVLLSESREKLESTQEVKQSSASYVGDYIPGRDAHRMKTFLLEEWGHVPETVVAAMDMLSDPKLLRIDMHTLMPMGHAAAIHGVEGRRTFTFDENSQTVTMQIKLEGAKKPLPVARIAVHNLERGDIVVESAMPAPIRDLSFDMLNNTNSIRHGDPQGADVSRAVYRPSSRGLGQINSEIGEILDNQRVVEAPAPMELVAASVESPVAASTAEPLLSQPNLAIADELVQPQEKGTRIQSFKNVFGGLRQRVSNMASDVSERAGDIAQQASEQASNMFSGMMERINQAERGLANMLNPSPALGGA